MNKTPVHIVYFQRDLRLHHHAAWKAAVAEELPLLAVFVWQKQYEQHRTFVQNALVYLQQQLAQYDVPLYVLSGEPQQVLPEFARQVQAKQVFAYGHHEELVRQLQADGITYRGFALPVLVSAGDLMREYGRYFQHWETYYPVWKKTMETRDIELMKPDEGLDKSWRSTQSALPLAWRDVPKQYNVDVPSAWLGGREEALQRWQTFLQQQLEYELSRDFPARNSTSQMSVYLAWGVVSLEELYASAAQQQWHEWLKNLAKRDFCYQQHALSSASNPTQSALTDSSMVTLNETQQHQLKAWQSGQTGCPLLDATMRCLQETAWIHHQLRLFAAKYYLWHLQLPPEHGEQWFAQRLLDFDAIINRKAWAELLERPDTQFNPTQYAQFLDPDGRFIRKWIPQLAHLPHTHIHNPHSSDVNSYGYTAMG